MTNINHILHTQALSLVGQYKKLEVDLLEVLQKIDAKKMYLDLGFTSLFDYSVKSLGLSESVAYNFVTVARKAKQVPALQATLRQGKLTISKARKITPVLTRETASHWISLAETLPQKKLERAVAQACPKTATPEKATYVSEERLELKLGISEQLYQQIKRVQDLESRRQSKACTFEDVFEKLVQDYLEKRDPLKKAERAESRNETKKSRLIDALQSSESIPPLPSTQPETHTLNAHDADAPVARQAGRVPLLAPIRHAVFKRDRGRCTHVHPNAIRCESQRWIEIHHIQPVSQGGKNTLHNLQTLCAAHHKALHKS